MRILGSKILLLHTLSICISCHAKITNKIVPQWIKPLIENSQSINIRENFSSIIFDDRTSFIGYIGTEYQKMDIIYENVSQLSEFRYKIKGYSLVKDNKCSFDGYLDVIDMREFTEKGYGVDDFMKGKVKKRGCSIAKFHLAEDRKESGSGVFDGYALFFWYIDIDGNLKYDDIDESSDSYSNNLYYGQWRSYKTKGVKCCAWGQYRIPHCGDLDIGAAEFSVNPKYEMNGWAEAKNIDILSQWLGSYSLDCIYGEQNQKSLDEFKTSDITISYELTISRDSCIFACTGFQTYYMLHCKVKEIKKDFISLDFKELLDGETYTKYYKKPFITIYQKGHKYYMKSPYISDHNGKIDIQIECQKIND